MSEVVFEAMLLFPDGSESLDLPAGARILSPLELLAEAAE